MAILLDLAVLIRVRRSSVEEKIGSCFSSLSSLTMLSCHQFVDVSFYLLGMDSILHEPLGLLLMRKANRFDN
jgi:hypothetical protein